MKDGAELCSTVWAVIRHGLLEKVPDSGMGSQDWLLAGSRTETEGQRGKGFLSRGKPTYKGWS